MDKSAVQVANYFIKSGIDSGCRVTPMQLQKLLYFAYGWHLAFGKGRLFDENIEAWKYGPVIKSIYAQTKQYGNTQISELISDCENYDECIPEIDSDDIETMSFLDSIWRTYKKYDGIQLANLTHEKDSPWELIAKQHPKGIPYYQKISDAEIEKYFKAEMAKIQAVE